MLELYHHGSSVCAAKVRLFLEEKRLPWEGHYIDILKGDQFAPEYMKINPKAVVAVVSVMGRNRCCAAATIASLGVRSNSSISI